MTNPQFKIRYDEKGEQVQCEYCRYKAPTVASVHDKLISVDILKPQFMSVTQHLCEICYNNPQMANTPLFTSIAWIANHVIQKVQSNDSI